MRPEVASWAVSTGTAGLWCCKSPGSNHEGSLSTLTSIDTCLLQTAYCNYQFPQGDLLFHLLWAWKRCSFQGLLVNLKRTFCANKVIVVQMSSISATGSLLTSSLAGDETFANHYKSYHIRSSTKRYKKGDGKCGAPRILPPQAVLAAALSACTEDSTVLQENMI